MYRGPVLIGIAQLVRALARKARDPSILELNLMERFVGTNTASVELLST